MGANRCGLRSLPVLGDRVALADTLSEAKMLVWGFGIP